MPATSTGAVGRQVEGEGESKSPNAAENALNVAAQGGFVPPRVTLTIELGTLTPDSVMAISKFINEALLVAPSTALGGRQNNPVEESAEENSQEAGQQAGGAGAGGAGGNGGEN